MSAVRHPLVIENCQIFLEGLRKHFQYVCNQMITRTKLENIFETNNTQLGHCENKSAIINGL